MPTLHGLEALEQQAQGQHYRPLGSVRVVLEAFLLSMCDHSEGRTQLPALAAASYWSRDVEKANAVIRACRQGLMLWAAVVNILAVVGLCGTGW